MRNSDLIQIFLLLAVSFLMRGLVHFETKQSWSRKKFQKVVVLESVSKLDSLFGLYLLKKKLGIRFFARVLLILSLIGFLFFVFLAVLYIIEVTVFNGLQVEFLELAVRVYLGISLLSILVFGLSWRRGR